VVSHLLPPLLPPDLDNVMAKINVHVPILLLFLGVACSKCLALESLFSPFITKIRSGRPFSSGPSVNRKVAVAQEDELLSAIRDQGSRLANSERISSLIQQLESTPSIPEPAISPEVYGTWRLIYTSNTDTSSPIQRTAVDSDAFPIYQDIVVKDNGQLVVKQIVKFSDSIELSVDALASTAAYPLPELEERKSRGTIFGINVLGVSLVGEDAKPDPKRPNSRIDFVFDEGKFDFSGKLSLPYPVPFRSPLFRDWVKGWIDITFLSDRLRISRGNKGTTFVLVKEP
jgi:PAP_fibrillin